MRRALLLILVIAVVGAAVWFFAAPTTSTAPPLLDTPVTISMPDAAQPATVNYVHDGDTLFLTTPADPNLKVRLLAIDTPEVDDCFGSEATTALRKLAPEGSTVYTLSDVEPLDQYGRSLLLLRTPSGELINLSLVSAGYAEAVFIGGNRLYEAEVEAAEDAAQGSSLGIWGAC
jgi:micrococcal nuclease